MANAFVDGDHELPSVDTIRVLPLLAISMPAAIQDEGEAAIARANVPDEKGLAATVHGPCGIVAWRIWFKPVAR